MAISIDTVYQRVLAIANKEQRGYITPQEFNLMANQAQLDMFEQYFYELNFQEKGAPEAATYKDEFGSFANMIDLVEDKLRPFIRMEEMTYDELTAGSTVVKFWRPPTETTDPEQPVRKIYRTGKVMIYDSYGYRSPKMVDGEEYDAIKRSEFHKRALDTQPVAIKYLDGYKYFTSAGENTVNPLLVECIVKPNPVRWGYIVVNEQALYNASSSIDFELHESDETDLVIKILELAGMIINKPQLAAFAGQEEGGNAAEENK